jgi:energy-coupling factor transporter ATP-binding protein EcfA2
VGEFTGVRSAPPGEWVANLVHLVGERVLVLHAPVMEGHPAGGGGDVDCAVTGLDRLWPLRLPEDSMLCQCLHYEAKGWCWFVERRDGHVVAIDTLSDPKGLGQEGFPTALLADPDRIAPSALQAAYLTAKRLRKSIATEKDWVELQSLASEKPDAYRRALMQTLGRRAAGLLSPLILQGRPPDAAILRRARRLQQVWRFRTPARVLVAALLEARRVLERIVQPTGLLVLLVGPDGSGKSTLADRLPELCKEMFTRQARYHWRPGLLPRPGTFAGRSPADSTKPHARPPRNPTSSCLLLGYYWLDFLLGGWLLIWPARLRSGLIVMERGWWDILVDPHRYRLDVPEWLVRGLGTFLPHPDLALILDAAPDVILQRKAEIAEDELARQVSAWNEALPRAVRGVHLDVSAPRERLAQEAREEVRSLLETRTISRLGAGWSALPRRGPSRWILPRGPKAAAAAALAIYHPITVRARVGWKVARVAASFGAFRLLPRGEGPPRPVRETLAPHLPPRSSLAVAKMTHPGRDRYLVLIVGEHGELQGVAKVATSDDAARALDQEAASIEALGRFLPSPLSTPRILHRKPGLLLLEAVEWRTRLFPWHLDEGVAHALGLFFRVGARERPMGLAGPAHGDCAPWNLLQTEHGWVLIDWEDASADQLPFFDLCHYLVQAHVLLGRPSSRVLLEGFRDGKGWVGQSVRAYAEGAGLPTAEAQAFLRSYLLVSPSRLRPRTPEERDGLTARRRLLASLGG